MANVGGIDEDFVVFVFFYYFGIVGDDLYVCQFIGDFYFDQYFLKLFNWQFFFQDEVQGQVFGQCFVYGEVIYGIIYCQFIDIFIWKKDRGNDEVVGGEGCRAVEVQGCFIVVFVQNVIFQYFKYIVVQELVGQ